MENVGTVLIPYIDPMSMTVFTWIGEWSVVTFCRRTTNDDIYIAESPISTICLPLPKGKFSWLPSRIYIYMYIYIRIYIYILANHTYLNGGFAECWAMTWESPWNVTLQSRCQGFVLFFFCSMLARSWIFCLFFELNHIKWTPIGSLDFKGKLPK